MATAKKSILIVEDEPFLLELYKARFRQEGYKVCEKFTGKNVLEHMKEHKHDLILLDIIMPEVDGYEVLQVIRKDKTIKKVPILIFSNLAQDEEIKKGLDLGADDYFIKSNYTPTQIVHKVDKMIRENKKKEPTKKKVKKTVKKSTAKKKK